MQCRPNKWEDTGTHSKWLIDHRRHLGEIGVESGSSSLLLSTPFTPTLDMGSSLEPPPSRGGHIWTTELCTGISNLMGSQFWWHTSLHGRPWVTFSTLWTQDGLIFIPEGYRVQATFITHVYCWTGARIGAFFTDGQRSACIGVHNWTAYRPGTHTIRVGAA